MTEDEINDRMDELMKDWTPGDPAPVLRVPYGNDLPCMHAFGEWCDCWTRREKSASEPKLTCDCGAAMEYTGTMGTVDPRPVFLCHGCRSVTPVGRAPSDEMLQCRTDSWSASRGEGWPT